MRKLWLLFTNTVTIAAGAILAVMVFAPQYTPWTHRNIITLREAPSSSEPTKASLPSLADAAKKAMPSVVNVYTSKAPPRRVRSYLDDPDLRRYFGESPESTEQKGDSLGSGVIVSSEGHILTNNHVVEGADEIAVLLSNGRTSKARIIGTDPETDLAVLKADISGLQPSTFGNSENLRVGDLVLAIGNPFGVGQTVTQGVVSATGRNRVGINTFENFIQTDAAINPGNSGGALVDAAGNLIGINSAILSPSGGSLGIGFAIPADLAKQVMEQIVKSGRVARGWIGIAAQDAAIGEYGAMSKLKGALITQVLRGGPAHKSGLELRDVIVAVGDKSVGDTVDLINQTAALTPGQVTTFTIVRGNQKLTLPIPVGQRPAMPKRKE
jgi:serine protease DegQ